MAKCPKLPREKYELYKVENPAFRRFLNFLRLPYTPPGHKAIATTLLDSVYGQTKRDMKAVLEKARRQIALRYNAKNLAKGILEVAKDVGKLSITTICLDNASNIKAAQGLLTRAVPNYLILECASYIVNLYVANFFKIGDFRVIFNAVKNVSKFFRRSSLLIGMLDEATRPQVRRKALQLLGNTRWQGKFNSVDLVLENRDWILSVVQNLIAASIMTQQTQKQRFYKVVAIVSDLYASFIYLLTSVTLHTTLPREDVQNTLRNRFQQVHHPLGTISYICDPLARRELPVAVTDKMQMEVGEYIAQQYPPTQGNTRHAAALYKELMDVLHRRGAFEKCGTDLSWQSFEDYTDPAEWWRIQRCTDELKELAIYALSINPITRAAKRN
ncbi:hypothetical protein BU23DRAFT_634235 [Bimuria novae-zelandiae CBS 107.79]|uniref:DUF659 domain-containing protein n=1 Tax=Bimuria novae-zelandiae CBS 107.79 TaxID=1447943 RepID=A0A6A5VDJ6_9PLEO|nr:hypothetical protein BU23DRAFT_634235 [Bimuria novae-zelandiae CBS 107.79]